jgi:phosphoribosylformimino-5-aminoimidazole carboxamide ribotide isomerase
VDIAREMDSLPLSAIIYTDISRDGMLQGPNVAATAKLAMVCKKVPIVHSGGVTTLADIMALKHVPVQGIIVGKALYEGTLDVRAAVRELAA